METVLKMVDYLGVLLADLLEKPKLVMKALKMDTVWACWSVNTMVGLTDADLAFQLAARWAQ